MARPKIEILIYSALACALAYLFYHLYTASQRSEDSIPNPSGISHPVVTIAPEITPALILKLDSSALHIESPIPILTPLATPIALTKPRLAEELDKFDITLDEKRNPIVSYQFVGTPGRGATAPVPSR